MLGAWGGILAFFTLGPPGADLLLWLLALAIIAGLPHGALDTLVLRKLEGGRWWLIGLLIYAIVAALGVVAWLISPAITLAAFLAVAWFHFGVSDSLFERAGFPGVSLQRAWQRPVEGLVRGGAPLCLPSTFHGERTAELFGMLAGEASGSFLVQLFGWAFWVWGVGLVLILVEAIRTRHWRVASELLTLTLLFGLLPPLVAFAIYFPLLHAPRSMVDTLGWCNWQNKGWFFDAIWPTIATLGAGLLLLGSGGMGEVDNTGIVRVLFAGLAAVTFPHVMLWTMLTSAPGWLQHKGTSAAAAK
jgi:Brp/Blh family beta-carotene 15,15'-monooxygenase